MSWESLVIASGPAEASSPATRRGILGCGEPTDDGKRAWNGWKLPKVWRGFWPKGPKIRLIMTHFENTYVMPLHLVQ